jgi:hypothetical protein
MRQEQERREENNLPERFTGFPPLEIPPDIPSDTDQGSNLPPDEVAEGDQKVPTPVQDPPSFDDQNNWEFEESTGWSGFNEYDQFRDGRFDFGFPPF